MATRNILHAESTSRVSRGGVRANAGALPSVLRMRFRNALAKRITVAESICDDVTASNTDRLKALEFLAKYGLGTTITETDVEGNDKIIRVIREPRTLLVDN